MKPRKMLCYSDAPYIESLMRLIETQSKPTIITWCVDYAERYYLPIWEKHFPDDRTPHIALETARKWLRGDVKMQDARGIAWYAWNVARAANAPAAVEAAAGAIANAVLTCHVATHSIRVAFYGAAAVAYDSVGVIESAKAYDAIAAAECARFEAALRAVAVENEPNPVPCKWRDMNNIRRMEMRRKWLLFKGSIETIQTPRYFRRVPGAQANGYQAGRFRNGRKLRGV